MRIYKYWREISTVEEIKDTRERGKSSCWNTVPERQEKMLSCSLFRTWDRAKEQLKWVHRSSEHQASQTP